MKSHRRFLFCIFLFFVASVTIAQAAQQNSKASSSLTKKEKDSAIEKIAAELNSKYVFPKIGAKMAKLVRENHKTGKYDEINDASALGLQLTKDLRAICKDLHLRVLPKGARKARKVRRRNMGHNHGFVRAEWLPGRIGYLEFIGFDGSQAGQDVAAAAMKFLEGAEALIIDVRQNGGGSPKMVAFLSSYLFEKKVHLNNFYYRPTDTTSKLWTQEKVPSRKFDETKPVYILTCSRTFSAAEGFTYHLKHLKRATVVGETTGGGAHPVMFVSVGQKLRMSLPFARAINPITKTNWEGVGVKPHVSVDADKALEKATELARAAIKKKSS